jgi:hypothetical protein
MTPQAPEPPLNPPTTTDVVELTSDRQDYDAERQIVTAEGKVFMRFQQDILNADRVQVSLPNRRAVAEGNALLIQGRRVLRGERIEYNFVQKTGVAFKGRGEVVLGETGAGAAGPLPSDITATGTPDQSLGDRLLINQPLQQVTSPGQTSIVVGVGRTQNLGTAQQAFVPQAGGSINRLRFEADRIDIQPQGWDATNVRITNDPFSPPQLEVRAKQARIRPISPYQDELIAKRNRAVFDHRVALPLPRRFVFDRRENALNVLGLGVGYDGEERGGLFIERTFRVVSTPRIRWTITPQFFIQEALASESFQRRLGVVRRERPDGILDPDLFGVKSRLRATLTPRTKLRASLALTSLNPDLDVLRERLRASVRLRRTLLPVVTRAKVCPKQTAQASGSIGAEQGCSFTRTQQDHNLNLEYSYRDRLFNGSLGFQTVQQSIGGVFASPLITLGNTGLQTRYQLGVNRITADTDRENLLPSRRESNRITLERLQGSATLNWGRNLWTGQALPATPHQGLKYTPIPVVPYVRLFTELTGVASYYTSGDHQNALTGSVGVVGQIGHFSRRFFDYTGFSLRYTQVVFDELSPFLFDRIADSRVLSAALTQQVIGPVRVGVETSTNLDTNQEIRTDYILEYSRRAYRVVLRYNPVQQIGSVNLVINDFNWLGGADPFSTSEIRTVEGGVIRSDD